MSFCLKAWVHARNLRSNTLSWDLFTHFLFQLGVVQPRDRGDWISGIRRAVDLSSGGQLDQGETSWEWWRSMVDHDRESSVQTPFDFLSFSRHFWVWGGNSTEGAWGQIYEDASVDQWAEGSGPHPCAPLGRQDAPPLWNAQRARSRGTGSAAHLLLCALGAGATWWWAGGGHQGAGAGRGAEGSQASRWRPASTPAASTWAGAQAVLASTRPLAMNLQDCLGEPSRR